MIDQTSGLATSVVAILCDGQNVRGTQKQFQCLMTFARQLGTIALKKVYAHWRRENPQWEELCEELEFECLNVISSESKKNNADNKLIAHCRMQVLNNPEITTVILLSGDGHFKGLVRDLQANGKQVIVITQSLKRTSKKLRKLADGFYLLHQLC